MKKEKVANLLYNCQNKKLAIDLEENNMRIIIVEDEARALRGLRNLIESIDEKYEVIASAQDGQKALELII